MSTQPTRQPPGIPAGGQFAAAANPGPDPSVSLDQDPAPHPRLAEVQDRLRTAAAAKSSWSAEERRLSATAAAMEIAQWDPEVASVTIEVADMQGSDGEPYIYANVDEAYTADGQKIDDPDVLDRVNDTVRCYEDPLGWNQGNVGAVHTFDVHGAIAEFAASDPGPQK